MLSRSRSLTPSCGACQCPISGESKLLFVQLPSALPVRPCTATSSSSPSGDDQVSATEYMAALARGSDDDHPGTAAAGAVKSANGPPSSGGYAAGGAAPGAPPLATLEELYEEQEGELLVYRSGKVSSLLYLGPLLPASHNALITQLDGAFAAIIVKPIAARRSCGAHATSFSRCRRGLRAPLIKSLSLLGKRWKLMPSLNRLRHWPAARIAMLMMQRRSSGKPKKRKLLQRPTRLWCALTNAACILTVD